MSAAEARPLRIAYVRLIQAALAIHMEIMDDPSLAGGPHLDNILKSINTARANIERVATAEGIDLVGEDA
mgnify:CR=1 FL=1